MSNICYVVDFNGTPLSPTKEVKAWYMIRKGKAILVSKYPMVIKLLRVIPSEDICKDEIRMGIDDGSLHTGIAVVQKGIKYNKVLLKGNLYEIDINDTSKKELVLAIIVVIANDVNRNQNILFCIFLVILI